VYSAYILVCFVVCSVMNVVLADTNTCIPKILDANAPYRRLIGQLLIGYLDTSRLPDDESDDDDDEEGKLLYLPQQISTPPSFDDGFAMPAPRPKKG